MRKRRRGVLALLLTFSLASSLAACFGGDDGPPRRPNIVLLLTDDQDAASIAYMPRLKRLLTDRGVSLSRYYISTASCCPSRATLLRGQYAHNTKVLTNAPPNGGYAVYHRRGLEQSNLGTWLRGAGYRTGFFGKYLNGYPWGIVPNTHVPPGWDTWVSPVGGNPYEQYYYTLNEDGRLRRFGRAPEDYLTDVLADRVDGFLAKDDDRPFFAYLPVYNPHSPATPAPRHRGMFADVTLPRPPSFGKPGTGKPQELRRLPPLTAREETAWAEEYRKRLRSLQSVDELIGKLIDRLESTDKLADTYVIFASDNGYHLGQHRLGPGKDTPYEEDVRVPFIVRGPGVPAGKTVAGIAGNVDIAPTLAVLAGVSPPGYVDGRSLVPLLRGSVPADWRGAYLLEHGPAPKDAGGNQADRTLEAPEPYRPGWGPKTRTSLYLPPYQAIRTATHLYVEYATGERELYDTVNDPYQQRNIADTDPVAQRLAEQLHRLKDCAGQNCRMADR
ncbi:hypothetical protein DPM19_15255 [Actinomadura craniellae]|uniref:Sulfatase N-terminal domain-containing protein n=1 Tax=Actinomadura craniellae TaxID=2231787 RepID=A0A365H5P7_9ACTN|nr:sulfatase [Actinomadura craniellae]RAY14326.1 hypothetical protein DPM19_15255 [Actinomadura craniellae]